MITGKELLCTLLKTVQTGQAEIRSTLKTAMNASFRDILHLQLRELETIETEIYSIACRRGWDVPEADPLCGFFTKTRIRLQVFGSRLESKIAGVLIRRNTNSMIHILQAWHRVTKEDVRMRILFQKFLDCETAGIHRMQRFL